MAKPLENSVAVLGGGYADASLSAVQHVVRKSSNKTMVTQKWDTSNLMEAGLHPELLLSGGYGYQRHLQTLHLGQAHQLVLKPRPAHNPERDYGFVGVVTNLKDLSASIWLWHLENGQQKIRKVIEISAEPAREDQLPPALKPFGVVPPLITDISLSPDDKFLYVACWGTGEMRQYDVSDPFNPKHTGSVHLGGIVRKAAHPKSDGPLSGGPQMMKVSHDGRRVYFSNSLYAAWHARFHPEIIGGRLYASNPLYTFWNAQFYPKEIRGWVARLDVNPADNISLNPDFFIDLGEGERLRPIRLEA